MAADKPAVAAAASKKSAAKSGWDSGLAAWRAMDYEKAHIEFATIAKMDKPDSWTRSGAAFWAARAADRMDERRLAKGYLQLAAKEPNTFYGQLAMQILREKSDLSGRNMPLLPESMRGTLSANPAMIHAIIMQESRFNGKAKSHAGARGLMQLMPSTAKHIDKVGYKTADQLYDENYNVKLGSQYIHILAKQKGIDGVPHLMLAAYNNGPYNVQKWLAKQPDDVRNDPLLMIETYPTSETRAFIERVMSNMWVYERLLNKRTSPSLEKIAASF